jgi:hypothetical protein
MHLLNPIWSPLTNWYQTRGWHKICFTKRQLNKCHQPCLPLLHVSPFASLDLMHSLHCSISEDKGKKLLHDYWKMYRMCFSVHLLCIKCFKKTQFFRMTLILMVTVSFWTHQHDHLPGLSDTSLPSFSQQKSEHSEFSIIMQQFLPFVF